jgi:pSer/pThr/pTyr-binding forkhead associated (FHA) protein
MLAITVNALYTTVRKRGTTRQLAGAIVLCVLSALLLLPAIVWFNVRFNAQLSALLVGAMLAYVAIWGWLVPMSVTSAYCLFTRPRLSNTSVSVRVPRPGKRTTRGNAAANTTAAPPKSQPGVPAPFVFGEDIPWGWLEHRGGRFPGQRLGLKRSVITIGREEDNEVWLDDDTASRYHAELVWDQARVYITDQDSLNGIVLNGRRMRGTMPVEHGDQVEIGAHHFVFEKAELPTGLSEQSDPLMRHVGGFIMRQPSFVLDNGAEGIEMRSADYNQLANEAGASTAALSDLPAPQAELQQGVRSAEAMGTIDRPLQLSGMAFPTTPPPATPLNSSYPATPPPASLRISADAWQDTAELDPVPLASQATTLSSVFVICDGEMAGKNFLVDRPLLTIGRGFESDVIINDASISRRHAQIVRQVNGDYVQDLASRNGTKVNDELLKAPRLLQQGDIVCLGNIRLEYTLVPEAQTSPLPPLPVSPLSRPISGPVPLRLPSKPKE